MGRVILFVAVLAAVIYFLFWTLERRRALGGSARTRLRPEPPRPPVAPDDDPDFLWRIDQERRRKEKDEHPDS